MKIAVLAAVLFAVPAVLQAQFDFTVGGDQVQVHSFASQGYAYSDHNNFLTMPTRTGSPAFTDGGFNMSTSLTDKLRVGAQLYFRNVGQLGKWQPELDWGYVDYRFKSWFGVRGGKVKSALGLYNDTQDMDSMQTFALLPQGVYPLDLRDDYIAHTGGDVYGQVSFHKGGNLRYTAYGGARESNPRGGYYYSTASDGMPITSMSGLVVGGDLRWETPVRGLTIGLSQLGQTVDVHAEVLAMGGLPLDVQYRSPNEITAAYGDYAIGQWHFTGEFRRNKEVPETTVYGVTAYSDLSDKGWFLTAAYRFNKTLEFGTYTSHYYVSQPATPDPAANHISDEAVTLRFDLTKFWYAKVEAHFMDGYGSPLTAHGFYSAVNPDGLNPTTNMAVVRTGFSF
jgi:hypothetical protein